MFYIGTKAFPWSTQAERMHPSHRVLKKPSQVCPHWGRGQAYRKAATHQGRWKSENRSHLSSWIYGYIIIVISIMHIDLLVAK